MSNPKQGESLTHSHLQAGDVAVVDQGYGSYAGRLDAGEDQGAAGIVRWHHHLSLSDPPNKSRALELWAELQGQPLGRLSSCPGLWPYAGPSKHKDKRALFGHLPVYRRTGKAAKEARKRVSRKPQKKQRQISQKPLLLRQCIFVGTAVASAGLFGETALAISRCRWQIALAIQSMKSLITIHKLRAKRGRKRAAVSLYGPVLSLLLVAQAMRTTLGHEGGGLDRERRGTWWRLYKLLKTQLDAILLAPWAWRPEAVSACLHVLMERPRKRKLQRLPSRVRELRHSLNRLSNAA